MATPQSTREEEEAAALHALTSQYRQLVPPQTLHFPPPHLLSQEHFQDAIYHALFSPSTSPDTIPPQRYTARVLKALVAEIEVPHPPHCASRPLTHSLPGLKPRRDKFLAPIALQHVPQQLRAPAHLARPSNLHTPRALPLDNTT